MAKTEVILTSNIVGLGAESDHVSVAAGYARNYLIPEGLAIPLTASNKRRLESLRQRRAETLAEHAQVAALGVGVPGQDDRAAGGLEHARRYLTGKGAFGFPVEVLGAQGDRCPRNGRSD